MTQMSITTHIHFREVEALRTIVLLIYNYNYYRGEAQTTSTADMTQMSISTHIHFREVEALRTIVLLIYNYSFKKYDFFFERYETENIT